MKQLQSKKYLFLAVLSRKKMLGTNHLEKKRKVQQTRMFTGLFGGELGIRTLGSFWEHSISSAAPSTTRTTLHMLSLKF